MIGEVIAIGDELTSGQRLDTNSQWISQQLADLGVQTIRHTTVGDNLQANITAMQLAAKTADFVICTGGLGPTLDDLTRQAMADAFGRELILDEASLARIESLFARRSRPMPERNRIQAMFPKGSQVVENPHGSAPGIDLMVQQDDGHAARFFALPGVPAEMRQMWEQTVAPAIESQIGNEMGALHFRVIKFFGIGESDVEVRLPDLIQRDRVPSVGITVSRATLTLRIVGRAKSPEAFEEMIAPTLQEIHDALGDLIFGEGLDELQDAVARELRKRELKFASLEIGAASWIPDWMPAAEGGEKCYAGGLSAPTLAQAEHLLRNEFPSDRKLNGESRHELDELNELDEATRLQGLAACLRRWSGADVALVVGAYPSHEQMAAASEPFPTYYVLDIDPNIAKSKHSAATELTGGVFRKPMGGHPDVLTPRMAKTGLDLVRRALAGLPLEC